MCFVENRDEMKSWVEEIEKWMDYYRAKSNKTNLLDDLLVNIFFKKITKFNYFRCCEKQYCICCKKLFYYLKLKNFNYSFIMYLFLKTNYRLN